MVIISSRITHLDWLYEKRSRKVNFFDLTLSPPHTISERKWKEKTPLFIISPFSPNKPHCGPCMVEEAIKIQIGGWDLTSIKKVCCRFGPTTICLPSFTLVHKTSHFSTVRTLSLSLFLFQKIIWNHVADHFPPSLSLSSSFYRPCTERLWKDYYIWGVGLCGSRVPRVAVI